MAISLSSSRSAGRPADAGFTLIEMLVVIVILGLLISLVAPLALHQLAGAKISVARQSVQRLAGVLDLYRLEVGSYPSSEDGLQALLTRPSGVPGWNGPYVQGQEVPKDPWNRAYLYRNPSGRGGHDFDLCSAGPDGQPEGAICNP